MKNEVISKKCISIVLGFLIFAGVNARGDFTFGTPTNLGPVINTGTSDISPSITTDNLELYFASYRSGGYGDSDVWVTTRESIEDPWGEPVNLGPAINSSGFEGDPCPSADGLALYYASANTGLMMTKRTTRNDKWDPPVALGPDINNGSAEWVFPSISHDGLLLYLSEYSRSGPGGSGGADLWVSTRPSISDAWSAPQNLGPTVNSSNHDRYPSISADGNALFFNSNRAGGFGTHDMWIARRSAEDGSWNPPVNLGPSINTSLNDSGPSISADGRILYFYSDRHGGYGENDLYQVTINPVVDLNSDGIVDAADMIIMVDNWGTDEPLCDIGPMPWGDGIVDVQDLIVLAEHLFEEFPPVETVE